MTKGKAGWQCVTVGCGRAKYQGDYCDACSRPKRPNVVRIIKAEVTPKIWDTGQTRRLDGRNERQVTDGKQQWWVGV